MKIFMFFINTIFWVWAFMVPVGVCGFFALLIYSRSDSNLPYSILLLILGIALGIWLAESIRKKHGLSHFFSRIMASPDLDPKRESEIED